MQGVLNTGSIDESSVPSADDTSSLENERYFNKFRREERIKNSLHWVFIVFIWFAFICGISLIGIRVYHMVFSQTYHWLCTDQLHEIDRILFSGVIGTLIGSYFNKYKIESHQQ